VDGPNTLEQLVLAPLAERVKPTAHGRVYPGRPEPFLLLLRLGPDHDPAGAYTALDAQLRGHASMLTRYAGGRIAPGALTVVLSGPHWPRRLLADAYERYAFTEGTFADLDSPTAPPSLVPLVSDGFAARFGWDPRERWVELPPEARHIMRSLVRAAHDDGRWVRFVDVPDRPRRVRLGLWRELRAAGADFIGTADTAALARFLRTPAAPSAACPRLPQTRGMAISR
jgi:hypothetical protein